MTQSRRLVLGSLVSFAILAGGSMAGQGPVPKVGPGHPNLAAAQRLTEQAYSKVVAAQVANEWDMDGHAAKAKDLLYQAELELKAAAAAASKNHK